MNVNYKQYDKYKKSNVEWLGDVPEHWETLANKHIFKLKKNLVGKRSSEYELLSLTLKGIIKRDMENPQGKFPAEFDTYQEVKKGNFVFCLFDVEETPRTVGLSDFDGMITGAYTVMETNSKFDNRFLYYYYLNLDKDKRLKPLYRGLRNTIPKDSFFSLKTFVPPKAEQTAIANYLNQKTAQIDQAIAQKERLITLLKERQQIVIHQAVTQGLDSSVELKDSGVEWIGDVPKHWEVLLGLRILSESREKNTGMQESQVLSLSYGKIIIKPKEKLFGLVPESFETYQIVKPNDIIIRCTDLQNDKKSLRTGIAKDVGIITSAYLNLRTFEGYFADFVHLYLHSLDVIKVLYKFGSGLRQNLSFGDFKRLPFLIPPKEEQLQIVSYINNQTAKIQKSITQQTALIEQLKEYKMVLIDAAVTGKVRIES